jgi:RNA polymerase sigma factor (sigma-70 family)
MNTGNTPFAGVWTPDLFSGKPEDLWRVWHENNCHIQKVLRASFCLSKWDMEEIMSIAMLKFYTQFPKHCTEIRNLSAWLARFAQNTATDYLRQERRRQQRYEYLDEQQYYGPLVEHSFIPAQEDQTKETLEAILLRARLSATLRETAIAHFVRGKTYLEIAHAQQIQIATVRKRIQIIREQLRNNLKDTPPDAARPASRPDTIASRILPGAGRRPDFFVQIFFQWTPKRGGQRAATLERYLNQREPRDSNKWMELAEMHLAAGRWEKARDCYETCRKKYPSILEAAWRSAYLHHLLGEQSRAQAICNEMLQAAGPPPRLHLLQGYSAWMQGDWGAARTSWEYAALLEPNNPDHHLRLFHIHIAEGRADEARNRIYKALTISPNHHRAMNLILSVLHAEGNYGLLKKYTGILYAKGDHNAAVIKYHADIRLRAGDCTPAEIDALRRQVMQALETTPDFAGLLDTRASQIQAVSGPLRLVNFLDSIIQSQPASANAWKVRAIWMCHQGRIEKAIAAARTAHRLAPANPAILAALAWVAVHGGIKELLAEALDSLTAAGASHPRLMLAAAIVSALDRNLERALKLSERALQSAGTDPFILYGRGRTLAQCGRMQQALESFQAALDVILPIQDHVLLPHLRYEIGLIPASSAKPLRPKHCESPAEIPLPEPIHLPVCLNCRPNSGRMPFSDLLLFLARCYDTMPSFTIPL